MQKRNLIPFGVALALALLATSGPPTTASAGAIRTPYYPELPETGLPSVDVPGGAAFTITPGVAPLPLRDAMVDDAYTLTLVSGQSASFDTSPPGTDVFRGTGNSALTTFPAAGLTYALLSSGNVGYADLPNTSGSTSADNGFSTPARGPGVHDTVVYGINFLDPPRVPGQSWCLSVDFRFLSEEFPEWVGTQYNDAFVAEIDQTTWFTVGGGSGLNPVVAPDNFAFTPNFVTVNNVGSGGMTAAAAAGTTYDGATPHYRAYVVIPQLTNGATVHRVYFSIFDQGDRIYDSTVFLDNLRVFRPMLGDPCPVGTASVIHP